MVQVETMKYLKCSKKLHSILMSILKNGRHSCNQTGTNTYAKRGTNFYLDRLFIHGRRHAFASFRTDSKREKNMFPHGYAMCMFKVYFRFECIVDKYLSSRIKINMCITNKQNRQKAKKAPSASMKRKFVARLDCKHHMRSKVNMCRITDWMKYWDFLILVFVIYYWSPTTVWNFKCVMSDGKCFLSKSVIDLSVDENKYQNIANGIKPNCWLFVYNNISMNFAYQKLWQRKNFNQFWICSIANWFSWTTKCINKVLFMEKPKAIFLFSAK